MKLFSTLFLSLALITGAAQANPHKDCDFDLAPCSTSCTYTVATSCNGVNCPIIAEKLNNRTDPQAQLARSILQGYKRGIEEAIEAGANPHDLGDFDDIIDEQIEKELRSADKKSILLGFAGIYGFLSAYYGIYKLGRDGFAAAKIGTAFGISSNLFYNCSFSVVQTAAATAFALTSAYLIAEKVKELDRIKTEEHVTYARNYFKTLQRLGK